MFNKKGMIFNSEFSNKAQKLGFSTDSWSQLCKLCKPLGQSLSDYEYFKFKWFGNTVVFWRMDGVVCKEIS